MSARSPQVAASPQSESAADADVSDVVQTNHAASAPTAGVVETSGEQPNWKIEEGTDVIGTCGHKIGEVMDVDGDYVVVEKGFFITCDLYVPKAAIASHDKHGIHLNMSKQEIDKAGWDCEPSSR